MDLYETCNHEDFKMVEPAERNSEENGDGGSFGGVVHWISGELKMVVL